MTIKFLNLSTIYKPSIHTRVCPSNGAGAVYVIPQSFHTVVVHSVDCSIHGHPNALSPYLDVLDLGTT